MSIIFSIIVSLTIILKPMEDTALISILSKLDNITVESSNYSQLEEIFNQLKTVNEKLMLVNNNMAGVYDVMDEVDA